MTEFVILPDVNPTDALDAVLGELALIDCTNSCQFAQYQAIRVMIGDEKFNKLFMGKLMIGDYSSHDKNPLLKFLLCCHDGADPVVREYKKRSITVTDPLFGKRDLNIEISKIAVGARVFFRNINTYTGKHLIGFSASFSAICVDNTPDHELYYAFGISDRPVSCQEICTYLIQEYNKDPMDDKHLNKILKVWYRDNSYRYCRLNQEAKIDESQFKEGEGGFEPLSGKVLNADLLKEIHEMPLEEVSWSTLFGSPSRSEK